MSKIRKYKKIPKAANKQWRENENRQEKVAEALNWRRLLQRRRLGPPNFIFSLKREHSLPFRWPHFFKRTFGREGGWEPKAAPLLKVAGKKW